MTEHDWLAERFQEQRPQLQAMAYRMLGSLAEAEDALQDSWFRIRRADTSEINNLGGWLTTVVSRVCLDMLRARKSRREEQLPDGGLAPPASSADAVDPEQEALLADSVGLALLVVLERLNPAERVAFILHDVFALSFDEIAPIVGRSPAATRQLASRARRRVQGTDVVVETDIASQREVIDTFLSAVRRADMDTLLNVLDPDVVLHSDPAILPRGLEPVMHGAETVAAIAVKGGARAAQAAMVDGAVGVVVAPRGRLLMVLKFTIADGRIVAIESVGAPDRLNQLDLAVFEA